MTEAKSDGEQSTLSFLNGGKYESKTTNIKDPKKIVTTS